MSGHRQAAVALHGLNEADRTLILEQLPRSDQAVLRNHLAELRSLGFESGLAHLAAPVQADAGVPPTAHERVQAAGAAAVFAMLEHEPASLVAQVLSLSDWRWRQALLEMYSPVQRDVISAIRPVLAPARQRFLLEALAERLAQRPADALPFREAGFMSSIRKWAGTWIR